ncbi:unnamed protein product [Medioppia subpectinata]|uniref:Uncharacterized protein n=1 Tax=Medioppia subpectinata TaxID=1979941 RepID=A0A7R9KNC7_9ACAR|nr:unnamed protein product [Medioppia subpectinata]CAG2106705.1 unnamed protein product [Medioppia subpectinata]
MSDSNEVKTSLTQLQNRKQLLTQKLAIISAKSRHLQQKLDDKRRKTSLLNDSNHELELQLSLLKAESNGLHLKTASLELQLNGSRDCVQRLRQQLVDKRNQQSIVVDQFSKEVDKLSQRFNRLTINNVNLNRRDIGHKLKTIDAQITYFRAKRAQLYKELFNKMFGEHNDNNDEYNDWPIEHRLQTLLVPKLFEEENQMLIQRNK